jgi:hypothetical protein
MLFHTHQTPHGSLEGFVLIDGRKIAFDAALVVLERFPGLLEEIVDLAKAKASSPANPA